MKQQQSKFLPAKRRRALMNRIYRERILSLA